MPDDRKHREHIAMVRTAFREAEERVTAAMLDGARPGFVAFGPLPNAGRLRVWITLRDPEEVTS